MSDTVVKGIYFGSQVPVKKVRHESFLRYGVRALLHTPFVLL